MLFVTNTSPPRTQRNKIWPISLQWQIWQKVYFEEKKNNLMEDFSSTADVTRSSFWILFEDKLTDKLSYWCLNMLVYDPPKQTIQVQDVRLWPQPTTQIQNNFPLVFLTTAVREWSPLPCVSWGRLMVCGQMSRLREQNETRNLRIPQYLQLLSFDSGLSCLIKQRSAVYILTHNNIM